MLLLTLNLEPGSPAAAVAIAAKAAVKLKAFTMPAQEVEITAGEDDLALLIPSVEPLSVGFPPVRPKLVAEISFDAGTRIVEDSAGYVTGMPLDVSGAYRPRFKVQWVGLTLAERNQVRAFLGNGDIASCVCHTRNAFDVELDGPGSGATKLRPVEAFRDVWEGKPAYGIEVLCEQVL